MKATWQIRKEIEEKFGFFPPFFSPAQQSPQVLESLWQQTLSAYVNNPLSSLFKEKLSAYLSRYCAVPYCLICHSCSLYQMGMKAQEILDLLASPPPKETDIKEHLSLLAEVPSGLTFLPEPNSALEASLLSCSIYIALEKEPDAYCRTELRRCLGLENYQQLVALIAYVKTCHVWMEAHSEIAYEADKRAIDYLGDLLEDEPSLADFFRNYRAQVRCERQLGIWAESLAELTEYKRNQETLTRILREQESIMEALLDVFYMLDLNGNLLKWNKRLETITGLSPEELRGRSALDFFPQTEQVTIARAIKEVFELGKAKVEGHLIGKDEVLLPYEWNGVTLKDEAGNVIGMTGIGRDITERKQTEAKLLHNALHDALTGLPNRALLIDRLERALSHAKRREDHLLAVLFLDLDRFKVINDSLGHKFGDQLLIAIAGRLATCMRPTDTTARLGGDEFIILLEELKDISDAILVVERIQTQLRLPFILGEQEVFITASIGIALSATGYHRPEDLLRDADIAMYRAKALGKARYEIFKTDMHIQAVARLQLENELRRAVERHEFRVHYQPIVSLSSGRIVGFEALVRWQHPQRGLLSPAEFILVAAETGLLTSIDAWVIREACGQIQQWQEQIPSNSSLSISANICTEKFNQPNLINQIGQILQETSLDASKLKLEITENVIMENRESATTTLEQLKALGIQLAIDDFGTGHSSLARLHQFPIDVLKLDLSFVSQMGSEVGNSQMIGTIVSLANYLNMDVVAEGVETAEQLAQLRALKCEYGQGYFFSRPLDSQTAKALIVTNPQW